MVEFMKERIGEEFDGHISGLTEWSIYVELDETHIEGMSFLRDIEGDFFQFDEANYEIVGRSTGRRMTLGDAACSVREVEEFTGFEFFHNLSADGAAVKERLVLSDWGISN